MFYLGIDVSKSKLDCTLFNPATDKKKTKVLSNDVDGCKTLVAWLAKQNVALSEVHGILEATGVYHEPAALWLTDSGMRLSVVNPAQLRDFARGMATRTKTDGVDSALLARYGALVQPAPWQAPAKEVRELKALLARLEALEGDVRREANRREKAHFAQAPTLVLESIDHHLAKLKEETDRLHKAIEEHIDRHPGLKEDQKRLLSIPAIGEKTANRMLALMHSRQFKTAEQLAAFLGLVPVEHQSGSSVQKRPRLAKNGDARTRAALYMAAHCRNPIQPARQGTLHKTVREGENQNGRLGRCHAQARPSVLRRHQTSDYYQSDW